MTKLIFVVRYQYVKSNCNTKLKSCCWTHQLKQDGIYSDVLQSGTYKVSLVGILTGFIFLYKKVLESFMQQKECQVIANRHKVLMILIALWF